MESSDTLTILTHFKTHQQTSEWSCGVSSALMVLDWYGKLGDYNEETLAMYRDNQLIIGYDTMGTEDTLDDVIIVADPYDATDHNQDGYGTYAAGRFFYNFTFYDYFNEAEGNLNDTCFLVAVPA